VLFADFELLPLAFNERLLELTNLTKFGTQSYISSSRQFYNLVRLVCAHTPAVAAVGADPWSDPKTSCHDSCRQLEALLHSLQAHPLWQLPTQRNKQLRSSP